MKSSGCRVASHDGEGEIVITRHSSRDTTNGYVTPVEIIDASEIAMGKTSGSAQEG